MSNSNNKKSATLGIPHGTANHRLRKNILFFLLKKHHENVCIRCSQVINTVEELSIEHIKPWEGISAELFWDLQNVAFSHLHCNRPHRPYSSPVRKVPTGMAWCYKCDKEKSIDEFHRNGSTRTGLNSECRTCKIELNKQRVR